MNWPIEEKAITELYLDQKNIRTPISEADQNALVRDMFENENAFEIAKSYCRNGVFPDEFPIAIWEEGKTVLIEGNRRLAALKALFEPEIVPIWRSKLENLDDPCITHIRVVIAPDRETAIRHIANKHTVDYRRPWKPLRQAYFYKSQLDNGKSLEEITNEFPEHNIPRFIKMIEMHHLAKSIDLNEALADDIKDERNFPITNLERFYNEKAVRDFLGIEFSPQGEVIGKIHKDEFSKGYRKILEDIAAKVIDSRQFNTSDERKAYIKRIPKQSTPNKDIVGEFTSKDFRLQSKQTSNRGESSDKSNPEKNNGKNAGGKGNRSSKKLFRKSEVPFKLSNTSLRLRVSARKNVPKYGM
jgi:hypothetical protein